MTQPTEPDLAQETRVSGAWKLQFAALCAMLVMALVGRWRTGSCSWPSFMGIVLTIMVIATATLEQYSGALWVVMTMVTVAAAAFFYWRARRSARLAREGKGRTGMDPGSA